MVGLLDHRGPNDEGYWLDDDCGIALGHRRLSILDLSPAGHQPMVSASGRFVLVLNGEIYNHLDLRRELNVTHLSETSRQGDEALLGGGSSWRGHSDTETLLAAFERWGVDETLRRTVGMFALGLWDRAERWLHLARDRMGEKPLYYGWCRGGFVFASELKALRAYPGFDNAIDRDALAAYLRFVYVPEPWSIYRDIYKLEPGCALTITREAVASPPSGAPQVPESELAIEPPSPESSCAAEGFASYPNSQADGLSLRRWWSLREAAVVGQSDLLMGESEAVDALEQQLRTSIRLQSVADVPLGAFLSGGVDSSTIVALMQEEAMSPVRTFTIGFESSDHDEANHAQAVARHLGTDHTELYVTAQDGLDLIPRLPYIYDEPFADSSQIPTHLVCRQAKTQVTVALSGDGGDELFGGYNRYFWAKRIWRKLRWLPATLRMAIGKWILGQPTERWDSLADRLSLDVSLAGDKAHKLAQCLAGSGDLDGLYRNLVSEWKQPGEVVPGSNEAPTLLGRRGDWPVLGEAEHRMMYLDAMTYLPGDILCKLDRAAMAVSLETRVPYLDHRVVELAWRLPLAMKIRGGGGKWLLRRILYKHVPRELVERPKQGFAIPLADWLRGPLRDWAEALLDQKRLSEQGYFHPGPIRRRWQLHLEQRRNFQQSLWAVLMFQAWLEAQS